MPRVTSTFKPSQGLHALDLIGLCNHALQLWIPLEAALVLSSILGNNTKLKEIAKNPIIDLIKKRLHFHEQLYESSDSLTRLLDREREDVHENPSFLFCGLSKYRCESGKGVRTRTQTQWVALRHHEHRRGEPV